MRSSGRALLIASLVTLSLASCTGEGAGDGADSDASTRAAPSYVEISESQGSVEDFVGAADDVVTERCEADGENWVGEGIVTNPTGEVQSYRIYVAFEESGDTQGLVQVDIASIDAGDQAEWKAEAPITGDDLKCLLRVERFAPQS